MSNKQKHIEKGQYGYIDSEKKKKLTLTIISFVAVFIIFITGVIIYHTNKSIFAVIAAVSALPAAKLLTMYIAMFPYKTGDREIYDRLLKIAEQNKEYSPAIGADLILTSTSKSMSIQFVYINNGKVVCFTNHEKTAVKEAEKYIRNILENEGCNFSSVKVFDYEEKFIKNVEAANKDVGKECADKRILEKMCAYSI